MLTENNSNKPIFDPDIDKLFDKYTFEHTVVAANQLPPQRCSDEHYIDNEKILGYYRNLDYRMIAHRYYKNPVINGMVTQSWWLVTSMSKIGITSPLNVWEWRNIHPGKKRYIIANYLQLQEVPVLNQFVKGDTQFSLGGTQIRNKEQLDSIYGNNYTAQIAKKKSGVERLECSWHGITHMRDKNGYDNWYAASHQAANTHAILDYIMEWGLMVKTINTNGIQQNDIFDTHYYPRCSTDANFYIELPDDKWTEYDLWSLYFHFDPTVRTKTCTTTGIKIVNNMALTDADIEVDLYGTLSKSWLSDPEA